MKGFPNQIADLGKLASGLGVLLRLAEQGENTKDDGVYGVALVRAGVLRAGRRPIPVDDYIREQRGKTTSNQSFRATARGLRQLYRLLGLVDDSGDLLISDSGRSAAAFSDRNEIDSEQREFWRRVIRNMTHADASGNTSHPYQVMLRLVGRQPGITRAKCALALEALDDSTAELDRIVALADLAEHEIRRRIGVTAANWDNAKKILPSFAEQLGDVVRVGHSYYLAEAPGTGHISARPRAANGESPRPSRPQRARVPSTAREVTAETIAVAGIQERSDEVTVPRVVDEEAIAAAINARLIRLRRHNLLVRELAARFSAAGARLYDDPMMDLLALFDDVGVLVEIKTLNATPLDERERVRDALGQLLYYEVFVTPATVGQVRKVACFESRITEAHREWLNRSGIAVVWKEDGSFAGDDLAGDYLGRFIEELA